MSFAIEQLFLLDYFLALAHCASTVKFETLIHCLPEVATMELFIGWKYDIMKVLSHSSKCFCYGKVCELKNDLASGLEGKHYFTVVSHIEEHK